MLMGHINLIPVTRLMDDQVAAEFSVIRNLIEKLGTQIRKHGRAYEPIPISRFTMGADHDQFFFDKGEYIAARGFQLKDEASRRASKGADGLHQISRDINWLLKWPDHLYNRWTPHPDDIKQTMGWLLNTMHGSVHTYYGKRVSLEVANGIAVGIIRDYPNAKSFFAAA